MNESDVTLQPWADADLPLLEKLLGDPEMMEHLGGPESLEQIRQRHERYLQLPETDRMFVILVNKLWWRRLDEDALLDAALADIRQARTLPGSPPVPAPEATAS